MVFEELKLNRGGNPNNVLVNAVVCEEGKVVKFAHPSANSNRANIVAANAGAGITGVIPKRSHDVFGLRMTTALTCKPLSAILGEAGVRHVDFFSLDCEGAELAVLETLDFDAVKVLVIMIEQKGENPEKDGAVRALMGRHGFRLHSRAGQWCSNEMWVHPEFATAHNYTKGFVLLYNPQSSKDHYCESGAPGCLPWCLRPEIRLILDWHPGSHGESSR